MEYKFFITGDTNDWDLATEKCCVSKKVIDEWFKSIDKYIDTDGKFTNKDEFKAKWAKDCGKPSLINKSDEDAQIALFEIASTFIPSYGCTFSHKLEKIDVFVESADDFVNFEETQRMAKLILEAMQTDKMIKYMHIERNIRI